jgi:hypothetical protein
MSQVLNLQEMEIPAPDQEQEVEGSWFACSERSYFLCA